MSYLIDTDYVVSYLRGRQPGVDLITSLLRARDRVAISSITYGEVYEGIYYGSDPEANERNFRELLRVAQVLVPNRRAMRRFARVRGQLRAHGRLIDTADLLIAVTALEHDLTLATGNFRHFERVPDLKLYRA